MTTGFSKKATPSIKKPKGKQAVPKAVRKAPVLECKDRMVYTLPQLAQILQVTPKTARAILASKQIEARKVGQEWRVWGEAITKYMRGYTPLQQEPAAE